jgi:hypothetical protein
VLVIIVGILVISLSLALGFVVFVGIAGFVLVMGIVMRVRNWWLGRAIGGQKAAENSNKQPSSGQRQIIEGEYREVRKPGDPGDNA